MIKANIIDNNKSKYMIIEPNADGRRLTIRYMQYMYSDQEGYDGIPEWEIYDYGCGVCSLATIISSLGYDFDPIEIAKIVLMDDFENPLNFFTNKKKGRLGLTTISFVYALQNLVRKYGLDIDYELIKYSDEMPELTKEQITNMIQNGYMAMILVGPKESGDSPCTFSKYRHYIAITSVNVNNKEFYVSNPNTTGDSQIDTTYPYEELVANICNSIFLMVGNNSGMRK